MTARELTDLILEMAPLSGEVKGDLNGFLYGDLETEVTGLVSCWSPTADVIRQTVGLGCNFILSHEIMFFPRAEVEWYLTYPAEDRPHNRVRKELMDRFGLCHCRCHSNWDCIMNHGIADAFASALQLGSPTYRSRYLRTYELAPQMLGELARHCKARLGIPHVRVTGDLAREVTRVGIAYGGFGQTWECLDELLMQGVDCVLIGEGIDYTFRAALDAGIGLIETSHVGSENPGMREFARLLSERLPELPVHFVDSGHCWALL